MRYNPCLVRRNRLPHVLGACLAFVAWTTLTGLALAQQAAPSKPEKAKPAAETQEAAEEALVARVYNVTDLIVVKPPYPFRGMQVPGLSAESGMGGAGGMGGMPGTGGGFFSVADEAGMGGMSAGGMGMGQPSSQPAAGSVPASRAPRSKPRTTGPGGMGGGIPGGMGASYGMPGMSSGPAPASADINLDSLMEAIILSIEPASWWQGGGPGSISPLGGLLVINQTIRIHKKIEELLKEIRETSQSQRAVTIRARWLQLDLKQLSQLLQGRPEGTGVDRAALEELAAKVKGYTGEITCFDGQTVHIISGRSRSVVVGAIPVMGGADAVGYQPIVAYPQTGALLQVTPHLLPAKAVVLDLHSYVTQLDMAMASGPGTSSPSGPSAKTDSSAKPAPSVPMPAVDRVNLVVQQLETTVQVPIGQMMLVGGLTLEPSAGDQNAATTPQLYLFVEATAR